MLEKYVNDTKVTMTYDAANQMTAMTGAGGTIKYTYDASGNMTSKNLGGKKDTYTYNILGNLTAYTGYDGFRQTYSYDALGNMYEKAVSGSGDRTLLEEAVMGTKQLSAGNSSAEWKVTEYIYDIALSVPQVLTESSESGTITYEYGLERIAAYSTDGGKIGKNTAKTQYVHDAGGSVVQTVSYILTSELKASAAAPEVMSYAYTPFGEQLGEAVSGYGYNSEYYDASAGMLNLRARMYEPMAMRFNQRDLVAGNIGDTITINRYLYCQNNPLSFCDPMGTSVLSKLKSAVKSTAKAVKSTATAVAAKTVSTAAKVVKTAATAVSKASTAVAKASTAVSNVAKNVAANSNSKLVKSVANTVAKGADKVTKAANTVTAVSTAVAEVSTQVAETYDQIAADAWEDAKENYASAGKSIKEAANETVETVKCAVTENSKNTGSGSGSVLALAGGMVMLDALTITEEPFDWGLNISTDKDHITSGAFYVVADDLPFLKSIDKTSDLYRWGLGSYRAGIATASKQWKYGGIGVDVITANVDLNAKGIGAGINVLSFYGNVRIPLPSGEYVVIEADVGVGAQIEAGAVRLEASASGLTFGAGIYVDDYYT